MDKIKIIILTYIIFAYINGIIFVYIAIKEMKKLQVSDSEFNKKKIYLTLFLVFPYIFLPIYYFQELKNLIKQK